MAIDRHCPDKLRTLPSLCILFPRSGGDTSEFRFSSFFPDFVFIFLMPEKNILKAATNLKGSRFFTRRIWRLYPAYIVAVLVTAFFLKIASLFPSIHVAQHFPIPTIWDVVSHLTMLHGFFENQFYSIASVFWSLSLEFQLYLAYPLFLFAFRKFGVGRSVVFYFAVTCLAVFCNLFFGRRIDFGCCNGTFCQHGLPAGAYGGMASRSIRR